MKLRLLTAAQAASEAIQSLPYNNLWDDLTNNLKNFASDLQDISGWIAVIALIIAGVMFFFGGDGVRAGKRQVLWVLAAVAVIAGAVAIVGMVQDTFEFSSELAVLIQRL